MRNFSEIEIKEEEEEEEEKEEEPGPEETAQPGGQGCTMWDPDLGFSGIEF